MIGRRINNYEVIAPIGSGGMGAVYLARHPFIDRNAAIKILHADFVGVPAVVQRFFNEARAANAIHHPNIIEVLDVGQLPEDQLPYLLMEFLEGEPLSSRIARCQRLSLGEAITITWEAASALQAAHEKSIIHRDLKPDNIFLARDERAPTVAKIKVLDFGVAKLLPELAGTSTTAGQVLGTPLYMSPEQWRGRKAEVDRRSDVYALGIILYEMLTGRTPFVSDGFGELAVMHQMHAPRPPRELNPDIPPAVEAVILKALAKDQNERIASMAELQSLLAGEVRLPIALPPAAELEALTASGPRPRTATYEISTPEPNAEALAAARPRESPAADAGETLVVRGPGGETRLLSEDAAPAAVATTPGRGAAATSEPLAASLPGPLATAGSLPAPLSGSAPFFVRRPRLALVAGLGVVGLAAIVFGGRLAARDGSQSTAGTAIEVREAPETNHIGPPSSPAEAPAPSTPAPSAPAPAAPAPAAPLPGTPVPAAPAPAAPERLPELTAPPPAAGSEAPAARPETASAPPKRTSVKRRTTPTTGDLATPAHPATPAKKMKKW